MYKNKNIASIEKANVEEKTHTQARSQSKQGSQAAGNERKKKDWLLAMCEREGEKERG